MISKAKMTDSVMAMGDSPWRCCATAGCTSAPVVWLELAPVDRDLPEELPAGVVFPPLNLYYGGSPEQLVWQAPQNWRARLPFLSKVCRGCRARSRHFLRTVNRKYQ